MRRWAAEPSSLEEEHFRLGIRKRKNRSPECLRHLKNSMEAVWLPTMAGLREAGRRWHQEIRRVPVLRCLDTQEAACLTVMLRAAS